MYEKIMDSRFISKDSKKIVKLNIENRHYYKSLFDAMVKDGYGIHTCFDNNFPKDFDGIPYLKYYPMIVYSRGNIEILKKKRYGIVGRRDASKKSIAMARRIARKFVSEDIAIVSGFARGIDNEALDAAMSKKGYAIMILPDGILRATDRINKYRKHIDDGRLIFLSPWHPLAQFNRIAALQRNALIYSHSEKIYIPESSDSGGTWSGAVEGIKSEKPVFVRMSNGRNANDKLIFMGATPVDDNGEEIENTIVSDFHGKLKDLIEENPLTVEEIAKELKLGYAIKDIRRRVEELPKLKILKRGRVNHHYIERTLF